MNVCYKHVDIFKHVTQTDLCVEDRGRKACKEGSAKFLEQEMANFKTPAACLPATT